MDNSQRICIKREKREQVKSETLNLMRAKNYKLEETLQDNFIDEFTDDYSVTTQLPQNNNFLKSTVFDTHLNNLFSFNDIDSKQNSINKPIKTKIAVSLDNCKDNFSEIVKITNKEDINNEANILTIKGCYQNIKSISEKSENITVMTEAVPEVDTFLEVNDEQTDLQSLLILMALSNKTDDVKANDNSDNAVELTKQQNELLYKLKTEENQHSDQDFLTIKPLKSRILLREKYLLRKYVCIWKQWTVKKKEILMYQRQQALDKFFEGLTNKKKKLYQSPDAMKRSQLNVQDYKTYQHRYKVQKHIIALQKEKLEQQNRLIEELKYNKIVEASHQSIDALKDEVRKTYFEIDRHLKPKIKCLTNELQIQEIQEPSLVLHCLKMPQFLQRMEKRAREREERHATIRERRKQIEEERARIKQQAEIEKALMDNEEKAKRLKEAKEKRKREKIENIRKKQLADRMRALMVMADLHYEKILMTKYGITPLRRLLQIKEQNNEKAKAYYLFQLKKNVFLNWMFYAEDMHYDRNFKAEDFHRKKLLRKVFDGFREAHRQYVIKMQVAEDYYDLYVMQVIFRKFRAVMEVVRKKNEMKWEKVVKYHNSIVLFKTFTCWRSLPALNALKREQETRKARWRQKVLQVVPDYVPPEDL